MFSKKMSKVLVLGVPLVNLQHVTAMATEGSSNRPILSRRVSSDSLPFLSRRVSSDSLPFLSRRVSELNPQGVPQLPQELSAKIVGYALDATSRGSTQEERSLQEVKHSTDLIAHGQALKNLALVKRDFNGATTEQRKAYKQKYETLKTKEREEEENLLYKNRREQEQRDHCARQRQELNQHMSWQYRLLDWAGLL